MANPSVRSGAMRCVTSPLGEAVVLLLLAVMVTAGIWLARPAQLAWQADPTVYELELTAPLVEVSEALLLFEEGDHLFIDTRTLPTGTHEIIPGAFVIRQDTFDDDLRSYFDYLFPEDPLVLYGSGDLNGVANIAARLQTRGYENILIMRGGLAAWIAGGGETSETEFDEGGS